MTHICSIAERSFPRELRHAVPAKDSFRILRFQQVEWFFSGLGSVVISDAAWNAALFRVMDHREQPFTIIKTLLPDNKTMHFELFMDKELAMREIHHLQASYICFQFFMNEHEAEAKAPVSASASASASVSALQGKQRNGMLTTVAWRGLHLDLVDQLLASEETTIPAIRSGGIIVNAEDMDANNALILVDSDANARFLKEMFPTSEAKIACFLSRSKKVVLDEDTTTVICHSSKAPFLPGFRHERVYVYEKALDTVSDLIATSCAPCFLVLEPSSTSTKNALLARLRMTGVDQHLLDLARSDGTGILLDHLVSFLTLEETSSQKCLETSNSILLLQ